MITDLVQIERLGNNAREENRRFRRWMKSHVWVERQFRRAAEEVTAAIDCRTCASCCRVPETELSPRDIQRLMKFLGIKRRREFLRDYTEEGEDGTLVLKRLSPPEGNGCVFLADNGAGNDCTVYDARPHDCEYFPHLLKGSASLQSRMWEMVDRATFCPIVYNWMEKVKSISKFSSQPHK